MHDDAAEAGRGVRIDGDRLWEQLMATAAYGRSAEGGICRLALGDADAAVRAWFAAETAALGGRVVLDGMGSQFALFEGAEAGLEPIAMGSHLDTQPTGGRFDGVLGVLGGLAVVRALRSAGRVTRHPLAVVNWTNEEGARFAPAMLASGVYGGAFGLAEGLAAADRDGVTVSAELARHGWALGKAPALGAYFELHIEQGPVLEEASVDIGVVTGVQGIVWLDVVVTGASCHAGTQPMAGRRDPVLAGARMVEAVMAIGGRDAAGRVTVGRFASGAGARNTVAGEVRFSVDVRHPDAVVLAEMVASVRSALPRLAAEAGCEVVAEEVWQCAPVAFDAGCIEAVRHAAEGLGLSWREMVSGAGHDAVYVARVAPTGMVFVPCAGGVSHHPAEAITPAQAAAGADVLMGAVLAYDAAA